MWITLSPQLTEVDFVNHQDSVAAIETILFSAFRGEHIVFAKRGILSYLLTLDLSNRSKSAIRNIQSRHAELASIEKLQKFRVIIKSNITHSTYIENNIWTVPLLHFSNVALVPSCVLAENLRDAKAYINGAHHALHMQGIKGLRVNLTKDSGGGTDTPNKFNELIDSRRQFVIAITDTDKTHPHGACCSSSTKCADISADSNWVVDHYNLDCSEIENILPINLLCDSIENSDAAPDLSEKLDFLKNNVFTDPSIHKWFDLKNGMALSKKKTINNNEAERNYWISTTTSIQSVFQYGAECLDKQQCLKNTQKECECILFPGLGNGTLDRFNTHCDSMSVPKQCERIKTSSNSGDWLELGSIVASWGIALEKQRS
jgi:hypothetical protein